MDAFSLDRRFIPMEQARRVPLIANGEAIRELLR
jgi:hypothetical protein